MILLAWRFLQFQKDIALARWSFARTADGRGGTRKTMVVALARQLLIGLATGDDGRDTGRRHPTSVISNRMSQGKSGQPQLL
jgi:hypothetical protein